MMTLSQDGMVAVNSDNVAMFEVKETEGNAGIHGRAGKGCPRPQGPVRARCDEHPVYALHRPGMQHGERPDRAICTV